MHRTLGTAVVAAISIVALGATAGGALAASPAPAGSPAAAAPAPGEAWIVTQVNPDQAPTRLHLVRPDGTDDHALLPDLQPDADQRVPSWSPDGSTIAFALGTFDAEATLPAAQYRMALWTAAADGTGAAELLGCELPCIQLAWPEYSPDGSKLSFVRYTMDPADPEGMTYGPTSIETLDLATGTTQVLAASADGLVAFQRPRWSGDGTRLVVTRETYPDATESTEPSTELVVVAADGKGAEPTVLVGSDLGPSDPDWSWTTDQIAFARHDAAGLGSIWTVGLDGADPVALTGAWPEGADLFQPSWDPNGDGLLVTAVTDGPPAPALVSADGATWSPLPAGDAPVVHGRIRPTP
ncbi:MAG: hypothetical protein U0869_21115 [Chloroflexota bacterium]